MSFTSLPDNVIAKVAGCMKEYSDVCNLMRTNKRIYNVIKDDGMDKIQPSRLCFSMVDDVMKCVATCDGSATIDNVDTKKQYIFDMKRCDGANVVENIAHIINQCGSITTMDFCRMKVNSDILNMLNASEAEIGSIRIIVAELEFDVEEFVTFCKKFRIVTISHSRLPCPFWTDDVFERIIPHVVIEEYSYGNSYIGVMVNLSDRTLTEVFKHATEFNICGLQTSFTAKGIFEGILELHKKYGDRERLYFELGVLNCDQLDAANRYFNKDNADMIYWTCTIEVEEAPFTFQVEGFLPFEGHQLNYTVKLYSYEGFVKFSVLKPILNLPNLV